LILFLLEAISSIWKNSGKVVKQLLVDKIIE
jgi:hypothetical protein